MRLRKLSGITAAILIAFAGALIFGAAAAGEDNATLASQYYNRAVELHLAGQMAEAIPLYKKAIVLDPETAAYHADLGEAYRVTNHMREAIIELETAIQLETAAGSSPSAEVNMTLVNAYTTLGVIMDREDLPQRAIEYHRAAIRLNPDSCVAYNNLGHAYHSLGLIRAAITNYRKAIALCEDFAPAYDNLGMDLMITGNAEEAVEIYKKAVAYGSSTNPPHPQLSLYYNDLGAAYVALNRLTDAYEALQNAAKLAPDDQDIRTNMNFIKEKLNGKGN